MTCNKSEVEVHDDNATYIATVYLSDSDVKDIVAMAGLGGSGASIYYALVEKGILPAVVSASTAAIIGAVIAANLVLIDRANEGCGAVISIYQQTTTPSYYIYPQVK